MIVNVIVSPALTVNTASFHEGGPIRIRASLENPTCSLGRPKKLVRNF